MKNSNCDSFRNSMAFYDIHFQHRIAFPKAEFLPQKFSEIFNNSTNAL